MEHECVDGLKLPEQAIEECRQLISAADNMQFGMGDWLVILVDEVAPMWTAAGIRHPRAEIIRQLSGATGADATTLRDRETMARFYPVSVREEFDCLTYHQLRACRSAGDRWREYAEWARDNLPAPVAVIRAKVAGNGHLPPPWIARWERVGVLCDLIARDPGAPTSIRAVCQELLDSDLPVADLQYHEQPQPGRSAQYPRR
jgi:hypothetical protein